MQKYLRRKEEKKDLSGLTADELIKMTFGRYNRAPQRTVLFVLTAFVVLPILLGTVFIKKIHMNQNLDDVELISIVSAPSAATAAKKNLISIPTGTVKANPFLPYREINKGSVSDVPTYDLVAPPEVVNENSDAARVMDTIVSGILYDKFSPSAILNIEGNDYLVKKGDVVNKYKVLDITQNSVTVKLGNNTYNAGIGEILTEGSLNYNDVSNLSKKFGGERRWNIIIYKDYCQLRYY